jgi:hypothetical protein
MSKRNNIIKWSIISIFVSLYALTSGVSSIHVIEFFRLSNPEWLAITLSIAFELGSAASLAAILILDKTNKSLVWMLFILITLMQMMGNMYYTYVNLDDFKKWSELFGLSEEELMFQRRTLSAISGAILPLVSLGFIKALVDYMRPEEKKLEDTVIQEEIAKKEDIISNDEIPANTEKSVLEENLESEEESNIEENLQNEDNSTRKLKNTVYYDLDPTKIS